MAKNGKHIREDTEKAMRQGSQVTLMEDKWMNETFIDGVVSWEEQLDGTYDQIVYLTLKSGRIIEQIMQSGISKKKFFELRLKGDDLWPPTETTLTMGN